VSASYEAFLRRKTQEGADHGFTPSYMPPGVFDFQESLIEWAVAKGRAAIFADTGLGKTLMQLAWAENVRRHTNRPVLILTPLAVAAQTVREAAKFDIEARRAPQGIIGTCINVANYQRLHYFNPADFSGVVCDESSILKSFDGATKQAVTDFMRKVPYRLLTTATAAPNDYIELGTSSEALGYLGHMDMLMRFFRNDQNNSTSRRNYGQVVKWRFKGHSEQPFWRWVCSWARALRKPSDLGFDDSRFVLPPLREQQHEIAITTPGEGQLFALPAATLREEREERRRTLRERCELAATIANHADPVVLWAHLNDEANLIERILPGAVQVSGSDSDEVKEEAFLGFSDGQIRALVTKPKIGAWGMNWQHCAHTVTFPTHSFEQYYQCVRRFHRFGQRRSVLVDIITTEGERRVLANLQSKSAAADRMFSNLVAEMNHSISLVSAHDYSTSTKVPSWLSLIN
jgi:hypothetical protein